MTARLLILMRHAKAVDRLDDVDDFQRGLTARGREDCAEAAKTLADAGLGADLALVSPAWRTRQTYEVIAASLGAPTVEDPMALYHASTEMLERAALDGLSRALRVVLVGHNPGIGGLAHKLAIRSGARARMPVGYPTAAATAFSLDDGSLSAPQLLVSFDPKS